MFKFHKLFRFLEDNEKFFSWIGGLFIVTMVFYQWNCIMDFLQIDLSDPETSNFYREKIWLSALVALAIGFFLSSIYKKLQEMAEPKNAFLERRWDDKPKNKFEDDLLGRNKTVKILEDLLKQKHATTFTIHIDGKWGEGKTTVINFLLSRINKNKDYLIFKFNPWSFSSEKPLMQGFLEELLHQHPFLSVEVKELSDLLLKNTKNFLNISLPAKKVSIEEIKKRIIKKLSTRGQKLIIIIDDIDRIPKGKFLELFKIVGEFQFEGAKNILFILSFDKEVIDGCLKDELKVDPNYLQKIVNLSIKIINFQKDIDEFFIRNLEKEFFDLGIGEEKFKAVAECYKRLSTRTNDHIFSNIKGGWQFETLRAVKIFLNSFCPAYKLIADDVNVEDFFLLHVLKIFFSNVYRDIFLNKNIYLSNTFRAYMLDSGPLQNEMKSVIKNHVEEIIENSGLYKKFIKSTITTLFPGTENSLKNISHTRSLESAIKEQRIFHDSTFPLYFMEDLPQGRVSNGVVFKILKDWKKISDKKKKDIFKLEKKRDGEKAYYLQPTLQLIELHIEKIPTEDLNTFIDDCAYLLPQGNNEENNYSYCARMIFKATEVLMHYKKNIDVGEDADNKKLERYKGVIEKSKNIEFASDFIENYRLKNDWHEKDKDEFYQSLRKILANRYEKEVIKKKRNLFNEYQNPIHALLRLYEAFGVDRGKAANYAFRMFKQNYQSFIYILEAFKRNFLTEDLKDFPSYLPVDKSKELAKLLIRKRGLKKNEKEILKLFIQACIKDGHDFKVLAKPS